MNWVNYHHLLYFFTVAREGGLVAAGKLLGLSPSALSSQIKKLEDQLGYRLFEKQGRKLGLTETGTIVFQYAEEIFGLGSEMVDTVRGGGERLRRLKVGISDVVSKLLVRELLAPALADEHLLLTCYEDRLDHLLTELSNHTLDVLITESPVPATSAVRAFNHLLGSSTVTLLAPAEQAAALRADFPRSLDGARVVLPLPGSMLRRSIETFFAQHALRPVIRAEAEDAALIKAFAADGMGAVFVPTVITPAIVAQYRLEVVREVPSIVERYYAISAERRVVHPAVLAIRAAARSDVF